MRDTNIAALNKPKLFVGIERRMLVVSFFISLIVGVGNGKSMLQSIAGIVLFFCLCPVALFLTRKDDRLLPISMHVRRQKGLYDPGKRVHDVEVEIC